jgi:hypothetical protein
MRDPFERNFHARMVINRASRHLAQQCAVYVADPRYFNGRRLHIPDSPIGEAFFIIERSIVELEREFESLKSQQARKRKKARPA